MILYAAPGDTDTWNISGPTFLRVYIAVSAVVVIGTLVYRRWLFRAAASTPTRLGPQAAAYLNGGAKLAIYSCLGGLRIAEAIDVVDDRRLRQTGRLPAGATALDQAVYNAAGQRLRPRELAGDRWVIDAVQGLRTGLERAGLVTTAEQRRAARPGPLLLLGLLALGVARMVAGIANDKPVDYLMVTLIVLAPATAVLFVRIPRRTRAGDVALRGMRLENRHLEPAQQPAWSTYGPVAAGMGVALFGTSALWAAEPAFASASEVERRLGVASGGGASVHYGDGGGHAGGSCGGGSSCGGGGGCGGGGCGG
jgi:uncharacterized protein (TIGR04222 family)